MSTHSPLPDGNGIWSNASCGQPFDWWFWTWQLTLDVRVNYGHLVSSCRQQRCSGLTRNKTIGQFIYFFYIFLPPDLFTSILLPVLTIPRRWGHFLPWSSTSSSHTWYSPHRWIPPTGLRVAYFLRLTEDLLFNLRLSTWHFHSEILPDFEILGVLDQAWLAVLPTSSIGSMNGSSCDSIDRLEAYLKRPGWRTLDLNSISWSRIPSHWFFKARELKLSPATTDYLTIPFFCHPVIDDCTTSPKVRLRNARHTCFFPQILPTDDYVFPSSP